MRQIGKIVNGFESLCGVTQRGGGVTLFPRNRARFFGEFCVLFALGATVERRQRAFFPNGFQRLASEFSGPKAIGHDGNAAFDFHNVPDTRHRFGLIGVEAF